ncbi:putative S-adenosyl-L-methionine-dependent methyltransferase [Lyophyllum shimeji]|uniref:S-adenosyl-L-methionine-dependent methyltransferase n=1 Tax=Lyophyllum shimeji TaxID=47721 RepID=A0A9P3UQE5_LYOSH|nr:putative S-adenosyl-L-methionine-dependent methyltransferase [Lyophyllum shimeji]
MSSSRSAFACDHEWSNGRGNNPPFGCTHPLRKQIESLLELIQQSAYAALDEYEKHGTATPPLDSLLPHAFDNFEANTVGLKKAIRQLEGACDQLCSTLAPPAHTIANRAQDHYWACLRFAAKTRIADSIAEHPEGIHVRELAEIVQIDKGKLSTILRLLATKHCFREVDTDIFANNRLSVVLRSSNPMCSFVELMTNSSQRAAHNLYAMLADPEYAFSTDPRKSSFMHLLKDKGHQGTAYDVFRGDPESRSILGKAMVGMNGVIGTLSILKVYPWDKVRTVCDVGSGVGAFVWPLLESYPHVHATLFDLPETIDLAKELCAKDRPDVLKSDHVTFTVGDFFQEMPVKGADIYYMRNIVHNWSDERAANLLRNVRQAMGPDSRLLIHDYIMKPLCRNPGTGEGAAGHDTAPEPLLPNFGAGQMRIYNQDLTMLVIYNAKERTLDELVGICQTAELMLEELWDLGETTVVEFVPKI